MHESKEMYIVSVRKKTVTKKITSQKMKTTSHLMIFWHHSISHSFCDRFNIVIECSMDATITDNKSMKNSKQMLVHKTQLVALKPISNQKTRTMVKNQMKKSYKEWNTTIDIWADKSNQKYRLTAINIHSLLLIVTIFAKEIFSEIAHP